MNRIRLSKKVRNLLLLSVSALSFGFFVYLATEVQEAALGLPELIGRIDEVASHAVGLVRSPITTNLVITITHLGSVKFLAPLVILASGLFAWRRRFRSAGFMLLSGVLAAIASPLLKSHYGRTRPDPLLHLVNADGFSFPSGHTLAATTIYLTLAILVAQHQRAHSARFAVVGLALFVILAIGVSRIYLGVHFFSDVLGGACVGVSIASLLGALSRHSDETGRDSHVE
jgi:undecaprenyl-diphosphatase